VHALLLASSVLADKVLDEFASADKNAGTCCLQ
jgi:hypothetical protein